MADTVEAKRLLAYHKTYFQNGEDMSAIAKLGVQAKKANGDGPGNGSSGGNKTISSRTAKGDTSIQPKKNPDRQPTQTQKP